MNQYKKLLHDFLKVYPFQPATAFWRAIEIDEVIRLSLPEGFGLDLGCGDGNLTRIILDYTGERRLVGIDLDPLETAMAENLGLYERVHTVPASEIPEEDNSFDFVLSNSVLEHIPELEPVMDCVARLLKPGGAFIFTVPSDTFRDCLRGPLMPGVSREQYIEEFDKRVAHAHYLSEQDWRDLLEPRGIEVETAIPYLNRREVRRWETLSRFTGGLLYSVMGKRERPITIQRQLGMRKSGSRMPGFLVGLIAAIASLGFPEPGRPSKGTTGCLLILARKKP